MAVFAESQQHQIEFANVAQRVRVGEGGRARAELGGNRVHLIFRDRHMIEPLVSRHLAVALGVVGRQAALVAEVHVPVRPVGVLFAQQSIHAARRVAAGKHDDEFAALFDCALGGFDDAPARSPLQFRDVGELPSQRTPRADALTAALIAS